MGGFVALFTGGKDSTLSLYRALQSGYEIKYLVTMISKSPESYLYHVPNIHLSKYSSEAIGIPLVIAETSGISPYEAEDLKKVLSKLDIEGIVVGGVSSRYQKRIFGDIAAQLNLLVYAPYWNRKHEEFDLGFEIYITAVSSHGLGPDWLGRKLNYTSLEELILLSKKFGFNVGGEGGDYESYVVNGPIFKKRIEFLETEKIWDGMRGELLIKKVKLVEK